MSICRKCNQNVPQGARFCPFCRLEVDVERADASEPQVNSVCSVGKKNFNNRSGQGIQIPIPKDPAILLIILGFVAVCIVTIIYADFSYNARMKAAATAQAESK